MPQRAEVSSAAPDEMETSFTQRAQHRATMEDQLKKALRIIRDLQKPNPREELVRELATERTKH